MIYRQLAPSVVEGPHLPVLTGLTILMYCFFSGILIGIKFFEKILNLVY